MTDDEIMRQLSHAVRHDDLLTPEWSRPDCYIA